MRSDMNNKSKNNNNCNNSVVNFSLSELKFRYNKIAAKTGDSKMKRMVKVEPNETKLGYLLRLKDYGMSNQALTDLIQEEMEFQDYKKNKQKNQIYTRPYKQLNGIEMKTSEEFYGSGDVSLSNSNFRNENSNSAASSSKNQVVCENIIVPGAGHELQLSMDWEHSGGQLSGTMMDWEELNQTNQAESDTLQAGAKEEMKEKSDIDEEQRVPKLEKGSEGDKDEDLEKKLIKIINDDNELQPRSNEMVVERTQTIMTPISAVQAPNLQHAVNVIDMMGQEDRNSLQAIFAKHGTSLEAAGLVGVGINQAQAAQAPAVAAVQAPVANAAAVQQVGQQGANSYVLLSYFLFLVLFFLCFCF